MNNSSIFAYLIVNKIIKNINYVNYFATNIKLNTNQKKINPQ